MHVSRLIIGHKLFMLFKWKGVDVNLAKVSRRKRFWSIKNLANIIKIARAQSPR